MSTKCKYCQQSPATNPATVLYRVNKFGVRGKWVCTACLSVHLELFDGRPHFLHADDCPNYCDYACNAKGFEEAEMLIQTMPQQSNQL